MVRKGVVYWMLIGGIIASFAPSPTDFLHFYLQNWIQSNALGAKAFWFWQAVDWYLVDTLWYVILLGLYYAHLLWRKDDVEAAYVVATIFSIGAIIAFLASLVKY